MTGCRKKLQATPAHSYQVPKPASPVRPVLGITMGDPAGVGPEVALKALARPDIHRLCHPFIIGDLTVLEQTRAALKLDVELRSRAVQELASSQLPFLEGNSGSSLEGDSGRSSQDGSNRDLEGCFAGEDAGTVNCRRIIDVLDLGNVVTNVRQGEVQAAAGRAAVEYIQTATRLALSGKIAGIVTGPINKAAMNKAGFAFAGHTELLAELTGAQQVAMLLYLGSLGISHVTTHVSLRQACNLITQERVSDVIRLTADVARRLDRMDRPIAVAGLNPHSGEGGLFGQEEIEEIVPAIERAQAEGIEVEGPLPPDTVFLKAGRGDYRFVVAMYHDQGHIPAKLLGFETAVNVTLGLPVVRTSVDHGTAFDIAGQGVADCRSMVEAVKLAARLAVEGSKNE